ncbi:MAG: hypothetical protein WD055_05480 [Candidatus Dependentiae bacterium]
MKLINSLFLLCISTSFVVALDNQHYMSIYFQFGQSEFDSDILFRHDDVVSSFVETAAVLKSDSDLVTVYRSMHKKTLAELLQDQSVLAQAKVCFAKIEKNEQVIQAFNNASRETQEIIRVQKWKMFRKMAQQQLKLHQRNEIPGIKFSAKSDVSLMLKDFLKDNEDLQLSDTQKTIYQAHMLILYALEQLYRNCAAGISS